MEIKHEIIRFNQLTKDSCNQEVLEYLNKEFSLIVMDPKERHYFDLEDSVNFFFKTRDEGNGKDHYLLSILSMGMIIKYKAPSSVCRLFHQAFLTNFENLVEKFNDLRRRHRDLIDKVKRLAHENKSLVQMNAVQAQTIKSQEAQIKELETKLRSKSHKTH